MNAKDKGSSFLMVDSVGHHIVDMIIRSAVL